MSHKPLEFININNNNKPHVMPKSIIDTFPEKTLQDLYLYKNKAEGFVSINNPYLRQQSQQIMPAIIHLIWIGEKLLHNSEINIIRWSEKSPNYKIIVWLSEQLINLNTYRERFKKYKNIEFRSIEMNITLLLLKYPRYSLVLNMLSDLLNAHDVLSYRLAFISDILRILFLYDMGGIYADINDFFLTNHVNERNEIVVTTLPPAKFFTLPFGFMMRSLVDISKVIPQSKTLYQQKTYQQKLFTTYWHITNSTTSDEIKKHRSQFYPEDKFSFQINNDMLIAYRKAEFLDYLIKCFIKELDILCSSITGDQPTNIAFEIVGPGGLTTAIHSFLRFKHLSFFQNYYLFQTPVVFSDYYINKALICDLSWMGAKRAEKKDEELEAAANMIKRAWCNRVT